MGNDNHNSQDSRLQEAVQAGHIVVTVAVPDTDVGLIIGKAGSTIKGIQDRSGANIQIPQSGDAGNPNIRTVSITHPHVEGANLAKQLIEDILGSKRDQAPQITIQVEIPDKGEFWSIQWKEVEKWVALFCELIALSRRCWNVHW